MIGFLSVASMSNNLVMFMPIVIHGWLTCAQISTQTLDTPFNYILIAPLKKVLDLATSNRHEYEKMKCDLEIYLGICLLLGWFIGLSNIVSIILYWQVLRVRYMINPPVKKAFGRLDRNIRTQVLPRCPELVTRGYDFISNFSTSMGSLPNQSSG